MHHTACGILVPRARLETTPCALRVWSLNHWATGEVPWVYLFCWSRTEACVQSVGALKSPAGAGVGAEGLVLTSLGLSPGRNRAKPSCEVVVAAEVMAVNTFCTVTYILCVRPRCFMGSIFSFIPLAFQGGVGSIVVPYRGGCQGAGCLRSSRPLEIWVILHTPEYHSVEAGQPLPGVVGSGPVYP